MHVIHNINLYILYIQKYPQSTSLKTEIYSLTKPNNKYYANTLKKLVNNE